MEKSNQQRLEEYLVGKNAYLKEKLSNGKVIMLSGKWGSGKTHFWKNIIEKDLIEFQTKKQKAYVYSSLYGNRIIDKIEDNIYAQAYLCSVGGKNAVISGYEKVKDFGKRFGSFCSLLDVSKLVDGIDDIQQKNIKKSAFSYLENGGIVCFDDFERKSKDIDLNDLFGFISHLAIDLNCKVVIILNDDVFEGNEKGVFLRVKEKSVSKFLKYEPNIKDLFDSIFNNDEKYRILDEYKQIILSTIQKTQELNARIYIQVLDNLVEWIGNESNIDENKKYTRYLILQNINFISNHHIYLLEKIDTKMSSNYRNETTIRCVNNNYKYDEITKLIKEIEEIENKYYYKTFSAKTKYIHLSDNEIQSMYFSITLESYNNKTINNKLDDKTLQKINNFIETGILINE
jgi:hypothetical protein